MPEKELAGPRVVALTQHREAATDRRLPGAIRADSAVRTILLDQLDALTTQEAGAKAGLDPEYLHDFRVAVRRTRTGLGQFRDVFPQRTRERFRNGFTWLGEVTGPPRDLDVYLLNLPDYHARLPPEVQDDLQPLFDFLKTHRELEQARLVRILESHRYRQLLQRWRVFLEAPAPRKTSLANARRPIQEVAEEAITRAYRRVIRQGAAISKTSPAANLHQLRKSCKKLRYLLEFFQPLYPAGKIRKLIKALKLLQENLGTFQDLEVQGAALRKICEQMVEETAPPPRTLIAMGMLVASLAEKQQAVRREFKPTFAAFSRSRNRKLFETLFFPS